MGGNLTNRMKHLQLTDNQESITQLVNYPIFGDEIQPCVLSIDDNPKDSNFGTQTLLVGQRLLLNWKPFLEIFDVFVNLFRRLR